MGFDARAAGFRMPAEFEPHAATWLAWPTRRELWGEHFEEVKRDYARLARAIAAAEPVYMVACAADVAAARALCGASITVVSLPIDDSWTRDSGPIFLTDAAGRLRATSWRFNAWGGKFSSYARDAALAAAIAEYLRVPLATAEITLEGGGILSDGRGTIFATETCILNENRNPGLSKQGAEREMRRMLGAAKIVWLPGDPLETGTDGHIDGLFALSAPGKALLETTPDPADERYRILEENRRALELARDAEGRAIEFALIPELPRSAAPAPSYCRSYVNFYIANGVVLAPTYGHALDQEAARVLRRAFPDRRVIELPIGHIARGGGGFHCVTQQQPLSAA
ncbi:MAG TPA: agmatine deiminase family protein [Steroidobacteraceae bacterium]|nr:agmatine deiminase family protein [Steroidobacteraceae bacterium]